MSASSRSSPLCSIAAQLGRLHIDGSLSRISIRPMSSGRKRRERIEPDFKEGHGEKIWIFSNFVNGLTVYAHTPVLKANKALRQLPFVGKKLKPSKLRKDYWRPLAMVQFPTGAGEAGRSVFHLMREFRAAHDVNWSPEMYYDPSTNRVLTKRERGIKLNLNQKPNAVADLAAVLGGSGKGNKMWVTAAEQNAKEEEGQLVVQRKTDGVVEPVYLEEKLGKKNQTRKRLVGLRVSPDLIDTKAETEILDRQIDGQTTQAAGLLKTTIFWANELDKNYAKSWPTNVTHSTVEGAVQVVREIEQGGVPGLNDDGSLKEVPRDVEQEKVEHEQTNLGQGVEGGRLRKGEGDKNTHFTS